MASPAASPSVRPARSARHSQEERSAATRRRLLDAALQCLAVEGHAGTTTTAVVARAGASRGAFLHHFPTRAALLSAAVRHLYAGLREDYERAFAALPVHADRLEAGIDLLWRAFRDPRLEATLELFVAARVDPGLRDELARIAAEHHRHVSRLARESFPAEAASPRFGVVLDLVLDALQGLAVRCAVRSDGSSVARTLEALKAVVAIELARPERPARAARPARTRARGGRG